MSAKNIFDKNQYSTNLQSATVAVGSISALLSETHAGTDTDTMDAVVNIGNGALLHSDGTNAHPGSLRVEAWTDVNAIDNVETQAYGIVGITLGSSDIAVNTRANVNVNGGTLHADAADVNVTTRSNAYARAGADSTIAVALTGAGGSNSHTTIDARNTMTLEQRHSQGQEHLPVRRPRSHRATSTSSTATRAATSRPIRCCRPSACRSPRSIIGEHNTINVLGSSQVLALQNATLRDVEGLGGDQRGHEMGDVLSLSLGPLRRVGRR